MRMKITDQRSGDAMHIFTHADNENRLALSIHGPRGAHRAFFDLTEIQTEYLLGALGGLAHERGLA